MHILSPPVTSFYPDQAYYDYLNTPQIRHTTTSLHFTSTTSRLLAGTADGIIKAYQVHKGNEDGTIIGTIGGDAMVNAILEIGGRVFVGSAKGVIAIGKNEGDVNDVLFKRNVGKGGLVAGMEGEMWVGSEERLVLMDVEDGRNGRDALRKYDVLVGGMARVGRGYSTVVVGSDNGELKLVDKRKKDGCVREFMISEGRNAGLVQYVACDLEGNFALCATNGYGEEGTMALVYLGNGQTLWEKPVGIEVQCICYRRAEFLMGGMGESSGRAGGLLQLDMEGNVIRNWKGGVDGVLSADVEDVTGRVAVGGYTRRKGWKDQTQVIDYYVNPPLLSCSLKA